MKKILFIVTLIMSCTEEINLPDLAVIRQSKEFILADGSDTVMFIVEFNDEANISKISASAEVINGSFVSNDSSKLTIVPVKDIKNKILARINVKSTTVLAPTKVFFNINEYRTSIELEAQKSEVKNITISASAFSVDNNFDDEIKLTAKLTNENGKKVSNGYKVIFEDKLEDGSNINGSYRDESLDSNNGEVTTIYTPGIISASQNAILKVTVLDENGAKTSITDQIKLRITKKD